MLDADRIVSSVDRRDRYAKIVALVRMDKLDEGAPQQSVFSRAEGSARTPD
ncbi:MAG: hypothetical protein ACTHM8_09445 [Sphingomonas sp.]